MAPRDWITYTAPQDTISRQIPVFLPAASGSELDGGEGAAMLTAGQINFDVTASDLVVGGKIEWRGREYKVETVSPVAELRHIWYRITATTRR